MPRSEVLEKGFRYGTCCIEIMASLLHPAQIILLFETIAFFYVVDRATRGSIPLRYAHFALATTLVVYVFVDTLSHAPLFTTEPASTVFAASLIALFTFAVFAIAPLVLLAWSVAPMPSPLRELSGE